MTTFVPLTMILMSMSMTLAGHYHEQCIAKIHSYIAKDTLTHSQWYIYMYIANDTLTHWQYDTGLQPLSPLLWYHCRGGLVVHSLKEIIDISCIITYYRQGCIICSILPSRILILTFFRNHYFACSQVLPLASRFSKLFLFLLYDLSFPCRYFFSASMGISMGKWPK